MAENGRKFSVSLARNPYAVPDVAPREGVWMSRGPVLGSKVNPDDPRWYERLLPHERLFAHHTLNSIRKDHRLVRSKVPEDALDLALSSCYLHDADTLIPKSYVYVQPETLNEETWRVLRNRIKVFTEPPPRLGDNLYLETDASAKNAAGGTRRKVHPSTLKLAIEGPHTDRTNPGYSRKIDGTFYGI